MCLTSELFQSCATESPQASFTGAGCPSVWAMCLQKCGLQAAAYRMLSLRKQEGTCWKQSANEVPELKEEPPLRKRLVEYQGFRSSTDFLIDTADCSLCSSIHFFHYFLFFLSSLTPFSSSIHLHSVFMLPPITTLMILNLTRFFLLWVHSTVYPSLHVGWKLWWYIILYCRCHVRRHVCSFGKEEEVVCTELQTKHQDVYSGTKGHHVSSDIILTAGSDTAFLVSLFFHWTRPHQPEFGDQLWDSFEVVTISLVGFCVYQVADIWYLVVLLNDLEYHRWSQVCKTTQVRVRFVPSLLAAGCHNNLTNGIWTCVLCCLKCVNSKFKIS